MRNFSLCTFLLATVLLLTGCTGTGRLSDEEKLQTFFGKERVNILITDSGLGGLSVFADLAERIRPAGIFKEVTLIYFNAQPHLKSGYNSMKTTEQKVTVFDNALNAMRDNFKPDLLLIACNTLSVLYPETKFSRGAIIPVMGIVGTGVDLIAEKTKADSDAKVILFATLTTVEKDAHRRLLAESGYDTTRIITQACQGLAGAIERGTDSEETIQLVDRFVAESVKKLDSPRQRFLISFNCTHYGYISELFRQTFDRYGYSPEEILDPNPYMVNFLFAGDHLNRYSETITQIKIFSQSELPADHITSIGSLIARTSAGTYDALKVYTYTPDLFEWRSITGETDAKE